MSAKPLIVFYGEESFLIEQQCRLLEKQCQQFSVTRFGKDATLDQVISFASTPDLFASSRLMFWDNPSFLSQKLDEKQLSDLEGLYRCLYQNSTLLVLVYHKMLDRRLKVVKLIEKKAQMKVFSGYKDWEQDKLLAWIKQRVLRYKKTITSDALLALEKAGGTNLAQLSSDIEKLVIYVGLKKEVVLEDVLAVMAGQAGSAYQLGEALVRADQRRFIACVHAMLAHREDPIRIFALIVSQLRLYIQVLSLIESGQSVDQVAKLCKKHPFYLKKLLVPLKKAFTLSSLKSLYQRCALLDVGIKSGKIKAPLALEFVLG